MKKISFLLIFLLSIGSLLGQNKAALKNYKEGTKTLKKGKFTEAIDLLTLSINTDAYPNAFYNRGAAYLKMGDTCNFCNDMNAAAGMNDGEAYMAYQENCTRKYFITEVPESYRQDYPNIKELEVILHKCQSDSIINILFHAANKDRSRFVADSTKVYTIVEEMPEFIGGQEAMVHYIALNITYPKEARLNQETGTVYIGFVVDADGFTKNISVLRGVSPSCDQEAIRVIDAMPQWKPGKLDGNFVAVKYTVPIRFAIGE